MPGGSPPRGGESERLRTPAATYSTFDGGAGKPARDGGSGASTSSGEADDGVFDSDVPPLIASPDAELEVEIVRRPLGLARATRTAS